MNGFKSQVKDLLEKTKRITKKIPLRKISAFIPSNKYVRIAGLLVIVIVIGFTGMKVYKSTAADTAETITQEEQAAIGDIVIDFEADGQAEIEAVNLDFEVSGKLENLYVKEGDTIKKGQVLASLDDSEYQKAYESAKVNYEKATASLAQTRQNYKLDILSEKKNLNELKNTYEQTEAEYIPMTKIERAYSKQELEAKRREYENAKTAYEVQQQRYNLLSKSDTDVVMSEASLETSRIDLESARDDLDKTILKSPVDAKVLNIGYSPGETVSTESDSDSNTADSSHFMVISNSNKVNVIAPVSETDLSNITAGMNAEAEFEAFPGEKFAGTVTSIKSLPLIDSNNLVTYDVQIELSEGQDKIRSGMTCTIAMILKEKRNVITISNKAVSMDNDQQVVEVKTSGGTETRIIETGLTDGKKVEITKGLDEGETVTYEEAATDASATTQE